MSKYKRILILVGAVLGLALLGLAMLPSQEDHSALAKTMADNSAQWFAHEEDLGTLAADLRADNVTVIGTTADYALVSAGAGTSYYVRVGAQQDAFTRVLAQYLGSPKLKVVTLRNVAPPMNPVAALFSQVSGQALYQLLLLAIIAAAVVVPFSGMLDFNGGFDVERKPASRFADVVGVPEAKSALSDICSYLHNPTQFISLGAVPPKGVLLEGPPGTGKTLLARALAGECGVNFIAINGSSFSDKFLGVGIARVKRLFKKARKLAPCVVFIDEIDGIGSRGGSGGAADTENNRIINALLVELDGFKSNAGVIVVGATNHFDTVDPALVREGRFDRGCVLTLPDLNDRVALYRLYAGRIVIAADDNKDADGLFRQLARLSAGLSPAAIAGVVNTAAILAVKDGVRAVDLAHFLSALEHKQLGSPSSGRSSALTAGERERIAVHESGHAIIATLLQVGVVEKVSIIPRGQALGVTLVTKDDERYLQTEPELQNRMEMLLAGRNAELLILGCASTGASDDLKHASSIALRMVCEFGFGRAHGPFSFAGLPEGDAFTDARQRALAEAQDVLKAADERCQARLTARRDALSKLTRALLESETVSGQVVKDCLGNGPISLAA